MARLQEEGGKNGDTGVCNVGLVSDVDESVCVQGPKCLRWVLTARLHTAISIIHNPLNSGLHGDFFGGVLSGCTFTISNEWGEFFLWSPKGYYWPKKCAYYPYSARSSMLLFSSDWPELMLSNRKCVSGSPHSFDQFYFWSRTLGLVYYRKDPTLVSSNDYMLSITIYFQLQKATNLPMCSKFIFSVVWYKSSNQFYVKVNDLNRNQLWWECLIM